MRRGRPEDDAADARARRSPGTSPSPAALFAIGAIGVLLRRSPLIILLSLEIMLNASNLAFVAFRAHAAPSTARCSRSR